MAVRWAVITGNWNNTATWNGGTLPSSGDDVYANGFTVTVNQDITVKSIRTETDGVLSVGGQFSCTTSRLITCSDGIYGGSSTVLNVPNGTIGATINVVGNVYGGIGSSGTGISLAGTNNTLTVTGNIYGRTSGAAGLAVSSTPQTVIVTGNVYAGRFSGSFGISYQSAAGNLTVTGNVFGGGGTSIGGITFNSTTGTCTINGNVLGGTDGSGFGVTNVTTGTVIVNGTATAFESHAAHNLSTGTLRVTNAVGNKGLLGAQYGIFGVLSTGTTVVTNCYINSDNTYGLIPTGGFVKFANGTGSIFRVLREDGTYVTLTESANLTAQLPAISNVRNGITYNAGASTGTMIVPSTSDVRKYISVDNTLGTATLAPSEIWDYLISNLTTSGSIGVRLKTVSTVQTTGDQIASL